MNGPFVSVVMSAHNYARFLGRAIESILAQTYGHFELIVVDDASTDDTAEVVRRYRDDRVVLLRREECSCSGVLARNDGLAVARGDLIAVADADDISVRRRLEWQVAFLARNPEVDLLGGAMVPVDERGDRIGEPVWMPVCERPDVYRRMLVMGRGVIVHGTMVFRRRVLKKVPRYNAYASSGDFEFILRASRYFRLHNLRKALIYRRRHKASVTRTYSAGLKKHYHRIFAAQEYLWVQKEIGRLERGQGRKR